MQPDAPIIQEAINYLKRDKASVVYTKSLFKSSVMEADYFSASYSHCFYSRDTHAIWNGDVTKNEIDANNSIYLLNCGKLVGCWNERDKIGYIKK